MSDGIQKLNLEHLPDSIKEMAEVIGLAATLKIVEERGGIRLSVPITAAPRNWLTKLIGREAMTKLVEYYSGEEIDIPRCVSAIKAAQDEQIYAELLTGTSQSKLARLYGYTERGIRKLKKRMEERNANALNQACLF